MFRRSSRCTAWYWILLCAVTVLLGNTAEIVSKTVIPRLCLNGAYDSAGKCVCNAGFSEYQGNCFLTTTTCPPGTILWRGRCTPHATAPIQDVIPAEEKFIVVPPIKVPLPLPPLPDPLDPTNAEDDEPEYEPGIDTNSKVNQPPPKDHNLNITFRRIVNNHNIIHNVTTTNAHNINNVTVYFGRKKNNGAVRTIVISNNETTVYEEQDSDCEFPTTTETNGNATATKVQQPEVIPCCKIVSPRVCRKQKDEWVCFHRKEYVCSKACTADVMYLRPRRPLYRRPWLVMPPMPDYDAHFKSCRAGQCKQLDCSGCLNGWVKCHPMCYTYDCQEADNCHFIDQELICKGRSSKICDLLLLESKTIDLMQPNKTSPTKASKKQT
uniref:Uncharacterized protein n=1 Tax=Anopheles farauti TaxID=69004 RepID=A0A182Q9X2_9DIPT